MRIWYLLVYAARGGQTIYSGGLQTDGPISVLGTGLFFPSNHTAYISAYSRILHAVHLKGTAGLNLGSAGRMLINGGGLLSDSGGVTITSHGLNISQGGLYIHSGGVTITYTGIRVYSGGMTVSGGGLNLEKRLRLNSGAAVVTGTVRINTNGGGNNRALVVSAGGMNITHGGLYLNSTLVADGVSIGSGGLTVYDGMRINTNTTVSGSGQRQNSVSSDGVNVVSGGVTIHTPGLTVYNSDIDMMTGLLNLPSGLNVTNAMTITNNPIISSHIQVIDTGLYASGGVTVATTGLVSNNTVYIQRKGVYTNSSVYVNNGGLSILQRGGVVYDIGINVTDNSTVYDGFTLGNHWNGTLLLSDNTVHIINAGVDVVVGGVSVLGGQVKVVQGSAYVTSGGLKVTEGGTVTIQQSG